MTVTLDIAPHIFDQVQAEARAQNRQPADLLREAIADRWEDAGDTDKALAALPPFPQESLADDLRAGFADIDAGRVTEGETFFAELRAYAGRK